MIGARPRRATIHPPRRYVKGKGKRKRLRRGRSAARRATPAPLKDETRLEDAPTKEKILRGRDNVEALSDEASRTEIESDVARGQVIAIRGGDVLVEPEDGTEPVRCILRKSTRVPHPRASALVVGDRVRFLVASEPPHVLTEVEPRHTRLVRLRRGGGEHVICANVDLAVIIASADQPPFKPRLVDRYLIAASHGGLHPVLVLNKIDLLETGDAGSLLAPYAGLPLSALAVSARTGAGIDALVDVLRDRTAVFAGQSGVGKSSLLNRLGGGLEIRTADVYGKVGKGRHTTSTSTLYRFPYGGAVVDTPGIRAFLVREPTRKALEEFFPDIFEAARSFRFIDCAHAGDEGCAIPEEVAAGRIHPARVDSYHVLREEGRSSR
jgi:ribosome biogenesis GTPase